MEVVALGVALVLYSAAISFLAPLWLYVIVNLIVAWGVIAYTRRAGVPRDDLGLRLLLSRKDLAIVALSLAMAAAAVVATVLRPELVDMFPSESPDTPRTLLGLLGVVCVRILFGTALAEELIFRSGVLGLWRKRHGLIPAILGSSAFYGLWHIGPKLKNSADPSPAFHEYWTLDVWTIVARDVGVTFLLGVGFALLRLWTKGIPAPTVVHAAINSTGIIAAYFALS